MKKSYQNSFKGNYDRVLLHICCAPDATYPVLLLRGLHYVPAGYFFNPNIQPQEEYARRLQETIRLAGFMNFELLQEEYSLKDVQEFFSVIKGFENLGEGSQRCYHCYRYRLEKTAEKAQKLGFDYFTTTITISPHKNSRWVFEIASDLEKKYSAKFLYLDFKKKGGFKASVILSRFYGIYRQNYCGCVFSKFNR